MQQIVLLVFGLVLSFSLSAACVTNTGQFEDKGDGTIFDKKNDLMWMKCSMGMEFENNQCVEPALKYDWKNAVYSASILNDYNAPGGFKNWRLPTVDELNTLVPSGCYNPAINEKIFPVTQPSGYWSISELKNYKLGAYLMYFLNGKPYLSNKQAEWYVRLVRNP